MRCCAIQTMFVESLKPWHVLSIFLRCVWRQENEQHTAAFEKNQERLQVGSVRWKCLRWIMAESKFVYNPYFCFCQHYGWPKPSIAFIASICWCLWDARYVGVPLQSVQNFTITQYGDFSDSLSSPMIWLYKVRSPSTNHVWPVGQWWITIT